MWSFAYLGNGLSAQANPFSVGLFWFALSAIFGLTGWVLARLTSGRVKYRPSLIARSRILLPVCGLTMSIFGVTLSMISLEPFGVVLATTGLFAFLAGMVLAAAFPPDLLAAA